MPTPAEQKALAFVAMVILLGGAVRVVRAGALAPSPPTPLEQQGLARQAFAASSSAAGQSASRSARGKKPRVSLKRRNGGAKGDIAAATEEANRVLALSGFPPPGPRIDIDSRPPAGPVSPRDVPVARAGAMPSAAAPVDLDTAGVEAIDRLPRVGPALARRIVANRDSLGRFRTLAALRRVKGIGPATLARLAPLVTFSAQARR